ncbi:DNA repair exonuclease [Streptococcaceae bacterium ESL0729]|nr:DNA repair exonuclease [Streptococcaceae bacterium ESL0729]
MKFLHIADLHLDREFEGLSQDIDYRPYEILGTIIDFALDEDVDFIILAGDNFHQSKPSIKMQNYFMTQLERLKEQGIKVFLIFGNHDYYREGVYWFDFPDNVEVFYKEEVESKYFENAQGERATISAFSYEHPHIRENKIKDYPFRDSASDYHIGLFHGEIGGFDYAPTSLSDLKAKDYDYWALGHIHLKSMLADNIVYPGTPLGRNSKEITSQFALVNLSKTVSDLEFIDLAQIHWIKKELDLTGVRDLAELSRILSDNLSNQGNIYSLYLKNYDLVADSLRLALENGELIDSLRAQGFLLRKLVLLPLDGPQNLSKTALPVSHLELPSLEELAKALPQNSEIKNILTSDLFADLEKDLEAYIDSEFSLAREDDFEA